MRYLILLPFLFVCNTHAISQVKAVTETGEEVILKSDGTWKYASVTPAYDTRLDTPAFVKSKDATFLLKGKTVKYGLWLDAKKWGFKSVTGDEETPIEYRLTLKKGDAYCMIIPETMELSLELLESAAVTNGKKVAPDIHIVREETRKINGNIVRFLELRGTVENMEFVYFGYYYTGSIGTLQFVCYTSAKLYEKYVTEMESLLNGFTTKLD